MLHLLLLTALATQVLCEDTSQPQLPRNRQRRIVGGHHAAQHAWPWQVSIQQRCGGHFDHICGGTLIRRNLVMTAAHCADSPMDLQVVLGAHDITNIGNAQTIEVSSVTLHPDWRNCLQDGNDIALLHLVRDATLSPSVTLATLPTSNQNLPMGSNCIATGWGNTGAGQISPILMQVQLPLIDHNTCSRAYRGGVTQNMICAGGGVISCYDGDSGGPLNCEVNGNYVVFGVTSFGSAACNLNMLPTVFTRVPTYIDWMNSCGRTNNRRNYLKWFLCGTSSCCSSS